MKSDCNKWLITLLGKRDYNKWLSQYWKPGVNFINILQAAFTSANPKSAKEWLDCLFAHLGS